MATNSRAARVSGRATPDTSRQSTLIQETAPISGRLRSVGGGLSARVSRLTSPNQLQREALAVIFLLVTALSAWVLWSGEDDGRLVHWWSVALDTSLGLGAFVVPVLMPLIAYRLLFCGDEPTLLARHYAGGFLFIAASVGLIELASSASDSSAGGRIGLAVATIVEGMIGPIGGGLLLFVFGAVGVFLITGTDVKTLVGDVRGLFPKRGDLDRVASGPEPAANITTTVTPEIPAADSGRRTDSAPPPNPPAPVINKPRASDLAAPLTQRGKNDASPAPVTAGEPMRLPEVGKLALYDGVKLDERELTAKAKRIEETLTSFKVEARVREINPGPAVTQYTLEPGVGIKVRRITELQNDLALALAAPSIRIEAPVPGMARVGIEIPNAKVSTVGLRETLEAPTFTSGKQKLPIPLGRDVNGSYVIHDLTKMPHLLIAGATGSGKSVCLTTIISTFLLTRGPDQLKMLMIDPKMVELTGYNGVPHLQCPVVTEMDKVVSALRLVLQEMERRYSLFSKLGVRNLDGYRMKVADEPGAETIPYLVVIIDELADLMMTSPDDVEGVLCRLAQMGRACGIHLILATQRPSVDVLTGLIKANVPARIAFAVTSLTDSRVVLDLPGAERLLGRGDMLFLPPDAAKPVRVQGAFVEDKDVHYIVDHWHQITPIPQYAEEWLNLHSSSTQGFAEDAEDDPLMEQAREIVRQQGTASASMLQRRLRIGYNRAARLIEVMEDEGMIGPADGIRGRPVLAGDY
jgi:S-DNA-T family DNA segregation ATPase FtsK/SpoIIIE